MTNYIGNEGIVRNLPLKANTNEHIAAFFGLIRYAQACNALRDFRVNNGLNEFLHCFRLGIRENIDDRTALFNISAFNNGNTVTNIFDNSHFMSDEDNRDF